MVKNSLFVFLIVVVLSMIFIRPVFANVYVPGKTEGFFMDENFLWTSIIITTFVNALFETLILFLWGFRRKREILTVLAANLLSWPVFDYLSNLTSLLLIVLVLELFVIIFETIFIYYLNRDINPLKLLFKVFIANLLSATIGYGLSVFGFITFGEVLRLFP